MINIVIQIDPVANRSGYDAQVHGRKIDKLELAHLLSQFITGLIFEGAADAGVRGLIVPGGPMPGGNLVDFGKKSS